jgi:uncharacterized damage-inducible protein DinB
LPTRHWHFRRVARISGMTDIDRIVAELRHAHAGDPWHGPSRAAVLADVTADEAHRKPAAHAHSIWELVLHMAAWTGEVARRIREGTPRMPAEGDFPSPPATPSDGGWREAVTSLDAAHAMLVSSIATLDAEKLDALVAVDSGVTHRAMLHGLAQHDAYHSGQIAMLKKIYRG